MRAAGKYFQLAEPGRHEGLTHHLQPSRVGWGGRIRTFEYGIQSPAPYRLATPHHACASRAVLVSGTLWADLKVLTSGVG